MSTLALPLLMCSPREEKSELDRRLDLWGRVWRIYPQLGQCLSLEGNYRSPQRWDKPPDNPPPQLNRRDFADAWDIELACRIIDIRHHWLLKLWHVHRATEASICRQAKQDHAWALKTRDVQAALAHARSLLVMALEMPAVVRKDRALRWVQAHLPKIL